MSEQTASTIVRAEGNAAAFLADAMKVVVEKQLVSDQRFVEIVTPTILAKHLTDHPVHKANLLLDAQGIKGKEERDASAESLGKIGVHTTAELLTVFLQTGLATPEKIRTSVPGEDWVKILSAPLLWKFISDGDWHKHAWVEKSADPAAGGKGRGRTGSPAYAGLVALLELLDKHKLITSREKFDQITLDVLIRELPSSIKDGALRLALMYGENEGKPLKAQDLFEGNGSSKALAPVPKLTDCIESSYLWQQLLLFVAAQQGWLLEPEKKEAAPEAETQSPKLDLDLTSLNATDPPAEQARPADEDLFDSSSAQSVIPGLDAEPQDRPSSVVDEGDISSPPPEKAESGERQQMRSQPPPKPNQGDGDPPDAGE